jgi:hypothetical protein
MAEGHRRADDRQSTRRCGGRRLGGANSSQRVGGVARADYAHNGYTAQWYTV